MARNRKASAKGRAMGAMKKVRELSILCGVEACLIIVPEDESSELQVWPPLPEAMRIIDRYRSMPKFDQCRKKMDGEDYVREERISKIQEQLRKAERDNRQRETTLLLHDAMVGRRQNLEGLTVEQLVSIGWATEHLTKKIKDCIAYRNSQQAVVKPYPLPYPATVANVEAPHPHQGRVMEVVKAEPDLDALACSGSRGGSGSYGTVGAAGGYVMQLDARFRGLVRALIFLTSEGTPWMQYVLAPNQS